MWLTSLKEIKDRILLPITLLLSTIGIQPYQLTALGAGLGLLAVYFIAKNTSLFFLFWAVWILMDMLDGALARHTKRQSNWQDFLGDRIVFMALMAKMFLMSGKTGIILITMLYLLVHAINFGKKQRYWIIHPDIAAFALFGFQKNTIAIWLAFILCLINLAILIGLARIKLLARFLIKDRDAA